MHPDFLKWMAQAMAQWAEMIEKGQREREGPPGAWLTALSPPFPGREWERFYREWLSFMGAVPKKDHEELEKKVAALEAEVEFLREGLAALAAGLSGWKDMPQALKPWFEFANQAARAQAEWFSELNKSLENSWEAETKGGRVDE